MKPFSRSVRCLLLKRRYLSDYLSLQKNSWDPRVYRVESIRNTLLRECNTPGIYIDNESTIAQNLIKGCLIIWLPEKT